MSGSTTPLAMLLSLLARALVLLVRGYRFFVSPALGRNCPYAPTCSGYALQALEQHGAAAGTYLAARRVLRCHPGCRGGDDPVPATLPGWLQRVARGGAAPVAAHAGATSDTPPAAPRDASSSSLNLLP